MKLPNLKFLNSLVLSFLISALFLLIKKWYPKTADSIQIFQGNKYKKEMSDRNHVSNNLFDL